VRFDGRYVEVCVRGKGRRERALLLWNRGLHLPLGLGCAPDEADSRRGRLRVSGGEKGASVTLNQGLRRARTCDPAKFGQQETKMKTPKEEALDRMLESVSAERAKQLQAQQEASDAAEEARRSLEHIARPTSFISFMQEDGTRLS
jgi:hypothetical protein